MKFDVFGFFHSFGSTCFYFLIGGGISVDGGGCCCCFIFDEKNRNDNIELLRIFSFIRFVEHTFLSL